MIIASILWGSMYFVAKDLLSAMDPIALVGLRMTGAAIIVGTIALILKRDLKSGFKYGLILGLLMIVVLLVQTIGLKFTKASNSGFISSMFIVITPIIAYIFYGRKFDIYKIGALIVTLAGLWLLTGGINGINIGDILTLLSALGSAIRINYISEKMTGEHIDPFSVCFHQFWVTGVFSLLLAYFMGASFSTGSNVNTLKLVYLMVFPGAIAFILQLITQKHLTAMNSALLMVFEPLAGAALAWTLGGEKFAMMSAVGGFIIVVGVMFSRVERKILK